MYVCMYYVCIDVCVYLCRYREVGVCICCVCMTDGLLLIYVCVHGVSE